MAYARQYNSKATWSLMCAASVILAPIAIPLGIWGLFEIKREKTGGWLFAVLALLLSGVMLPTAAYFILSGNPRIGDPCRALQDQARGSLRVVHYLEEKHLDEYGRFGTFQEIGFSSAYGEAPYRVTLETVSDKAYEAFAVGTIGLVKGDRLMMNQKGKVAFLNNTCLQRTRR